MTTYSELVTQIRDYTETTSDVLSDTIVNDFIEHAEKRIFREVDLDIFRSYQFATLTAGNPFVSLPYDPASDLKHVYKEVYKIGKLVSSKTFSLRIFVKGTSEVGIKKKFSLTFFIVSISS